MEETLIPIKIDKDLLNLKDTKGRNILEKIYSDLQKHEQITDDKIPQYVDYQKENENKLFDIIGDSCFSELSKTINLDIPKMNSYFNEWLDMFRGEGDEPPFTNQRILEIEKGSIFTMKELSDKNWIEEIEQQSYTYDGRAYERCEYALFETLEKYVNLRVS